MKALLTSAEDEKVFFKGENIKDFVSAASLSKKKSIPGNNYFEKIDRFMDCHISLGEMHM